MNQVKIKDVIQADLRSIKNELIENSAGFIQNLIKSLKLIKVKPFSAYKVDLSLSYLKRVYENAFPMVKHGGLRTSKAKESKNDGRNASTKQVALSSTWSKSTSVIDKAIVINLAKGIRLDRKIPSFVELLALRSGLSSRAIQKRIYVGDYVANCVEANRSLALFRKNKISHTRFLTEINKKETNQKEKQKNRSD